LLFLLLLLVILIFPQSFSLGSVHFGDDVMWEAIASLYTYNSTSPTFFYRLLCSVLLCSLCYSLVSSRLVSSRLVSSSLQFLFSSLYSPLLSRLVPHQSIQLHITSHHITSHHIAHNHSLDQYSVEQKTQLVECCPTEVFHLDEYTQTVVVKDAASCIFCKDPADKLAVDVIHSEDKFLFTVETTGSLSAKQVGGGGGGGGV
jgi:ferredoxin-like protein FixX